MHRRAALPVHPCLSAPGVPRIGSRATTIYYRGCRLLQPSLPNPSSPLERNTRCSRRRFTKLWHVLLSKRAAALHSILRFLSRTGILRSPPCKLSRNRNLARMFIARVTEFPGEKAPAETCVSKHISFLKRINKSKISFDFRTKVSLSIFYFISPK